MAMILRGETECMLCHEVLAKDDDIVATSHFIADRSDALWQYSDAGFHRRCFIDRGPACLSRLVRQHEGARLHTHFRHGPTALGSGDSARHQGHLGCERVSLCWYLSPF